MREGVSLTTHMQWQPVKWLTGKKDFRNTVKSFLQRSAWCSAVVKGGDGRQEWIRKGTERRTENTVLASKRPCVFMSWLNELWESLAQDIWKDKTRCSERFLEQLMVASKHRCRCSLFRKCPKCRWLQSGVLAGRDHSVIAPFSACLFWPQYETRYFVQSVSSLK